MLHFTTALSEQPPQQEPARDPFRSSDRNESSQGRDKDGLPTHIPTPEVAPAGSPIFGEILTFICIILLSLILRLAVPKEDSAFELALLLIAVGFAQVWLIFILLKSIRR